MVWNAVAAGAGALLSGLSKSSSSTGVDVGASKALMKYQAKLNRRETQWLNENQYSFMRTGLENAGYNPLLAVGATPASANISPVQASVSNTAQFGLGDVISNFDKAEKFVYGDLYGKLRRIKNFMSRGMSNTAKYLGLDDELVGLRKAVKNTASNFIKRATDALEEEVTPVLKGYVSNSASAHTDAKPIQNLDRIYDWDFSRDVKGR